jgi:ABC-2 type transport system ATP-binding protein
VTVVLSTHILPEVEALCDRVIILHRGRIVAQDHIEALSGAGHALVVQVARPDEALPAALSRIPGVVRVVGLDEVGRFRVEAEADRREEVARVAVEAGLLELSQDRAGLEQVFLRVTGGAA